MRKTLRGIFLGSAVALAATQGFAQQLPPPPGAMRQPTPPTEEQQRQYEILQQYLQQQVAPADNALRAIERLEDEFFAGNIEEGAYRDQRAALLQAMHPDIADSHIEYSGGKMFVTGCAADLQTYRMPVDVMIERDDLNTLFNENSSVGNWRPGSTREYVTAIADFSSRIRNELEALGREYIEGTDVRTEGYEDTLHTAIDASATEISGIENIDIRLLGRDLQATQQSCTPRRGATETAAPNP